MSKGQPDVPACPLFIYPFFAGILKMRAVTFGFKYPTTFEYDHADHDQSESHTPPINFLHSQNLFTFTNANVTRYHRPAKFFNAGAQPAAIFALKKRILIAPLNWGLGHATRCIPLVSALESMGVEVVLASDGVALHLLKAEFPHLQAFELPSYRIRYDSSNMILNIGKQLPRIIYAVRAEQWATERLVREHGIAGIISDNRYGCFTKHTYNIILTHQLYLRVPGAMIGWAANKFLRSALGKFEEVWAPDVAGEPNLSGELSHGEAPVHPKVVYIGPLSRIRPYYCETEYDVAVVLSGPEPQRTYLEQRLLEQAMLLPQKFIFIQGKTHAKEHHYAAENIEVVSYLTSRELNEVLLAGEVLVCRSGYSSIMDLAAMGKKAILIPTPGQTEQEYLAGLLAKQNIFLVQNQDDIDLETGLEQVSGTTGLPPGGFGTDGFVGTLKRWVENL